MNKELVNKKIEELAGGAGIVMCQREGIQMPYFMTAKEYQEILDSGDYETYEDGDPKIPVVLAYDFHKSDAQTATADDGTIIRYHVKHDDEHDFHFLVAWVDGLPEA